MSHLELRIPPLALVALFGAAMAAVEPLAPMPAAIPAQIPMALLFFVLGVLVAVAGVVAFRRHQTTVNPLTPEQSTSLVSSGIYRFSRNPMYLGFLLALLGWGVLLANWTSFLLLPAFIAYMNRFQILPEERALLARFGESFQAYSRTVRRWL